MRTSVPARFGHTWSRCKCFQVQLVGYKLISFSIFINVRHFADHLKRIQRLYALSLELEPAISQTQIGPSVTNLAVGYRRSGMQIHQLCFEIIINVSQMHLYSNTQLV